MKLSVVTTLYRSSDTVEEFVRRAAAAASRHTDEFEIIVVDDGSPDDSLQKATALIPQFPQLKIIELSRNFGHHKALMTGLEHSTGSTVFLIDSDLEEAPELLTKFWSILHDNNVEVVYGYQERRKGNAIARIGGNLAYTVFSKLIPHGIPRNHLTVRLMRRSYVDALLRHREHAIVIGGLWVITGFRQIGALVEKGHKGATSYEFGRRWNLVLDSVTSFSDRPLIIIFYVGLMISFLSAMVGSVVLSRWLVGGVGVDGWVSVILSVWFLGGLGILFIGVLGMYTSKIFIETKQRPYTVVREVYTTANCPPR